jgi:hypothetical protein
MSDTVELIAIAAVNVFSGPPASIDFANNFGFRTATRSTPGVYVLELKHEHDPQKLVVSVTRNNTSSGDIQAFVLDKEHIQIDNFTDQADGGSHVSADSSFFIVVWRVRD